MSWEDIVKKETPNNKALADISTSYFGTYVSTSGTIPSPIDNNDALILLKILLEQPRR